MTYGGWKTYLALGDSFTEGLDDVDEDGAFRGWADLLALELARRDPDVRYANLAVRGRRLGQIVEQQLPVAERLRADLVSIAAGGNDILGLRCDVAALSVEFADVLARLAATGATVVVFTGFDARGRVPLGRPIAARAAQYNAAIERTAAELGLVVVDLWRMPGLEHDAMWARDRLHLSTEGHRLVCAHVLRALGLADDVVLPEVAASTRSPWLAARREDLAWARTFLVPWVSRKLQGRSTGDLVDPKRPSLLPVLSDGRPREGSPAR